MTLSHLPPKSVCGADKRLSLALQVIYGVRACVCVSVLEKAVRRCRERKKERKTGFVRKCGTAASSEGKPFRQIAFTDKLNSTRHWRVSGIQVKRMQH